MKPLKEQTVGLWWLPERGDDEVAGILSWPTDGSNSLSLIGSFEELGSGGFTSVQNYPLVLGLTEEAGPVTLLDCTAMGQRLQVPGYVGQRLRAFGGMLRGALIEAENQLTFNRVFLQIPHLVSWSRLSGLAFQIQEIDKGEDQNFTVQIRYERPEKLVAHAEGAELRLGSGFQTKALGSRVPSAIEEILSVAIELETSSLRLEDLSKRFIAPIERLLMFALDRPIVASRTYVESPLITRDTGATSPPVPLEFVRPSSIVEKPYPGDKLLHAPDMLFELADYPGGWSELMPRWLEIYRSLPEALSRLFSGMAAPARFVESRFLNMAQVAEAIHRERYPDEVADDPAIHDARMSTILSTCPQEHREWLREGLTYSNEPRFRKRLNALVTNTAPILSSLFPKQKVRKAFVNDVIEARNRYTHPGGGDGPTAGATLHWLTERLGYVIRAFILSELNFAEDLAQSLLDRNQRYRHLVAVES